MGDLLAAVSLILAMIGVVYSVWYPMIAETLRISVPDHLKDAENQRRRVRHTLNARALPLAFASSALAIILLPEAWCVIKSTILAVLRPEPGVIYEYDAVAACLLLVMALAIGFAVHLVIEVRELRVLRRKLSLK